VKELGRDHPDLTGSMECLSFSLYRQGHFKEAVLLCYSMIVLVHQSVGPNHPYLATCYFNLAMMVEAMGLFDHAMVLRDKGMSLLKVYYPVEGMDYWWQYKVDKSMDWGYAASPTGFYPMTELQTSDVWIPTGYNYGREEYMIGPVQSY